MKQNTVQVSKKLNEGSIFFAMSSSDSLMNPESKDFDKVWWLYSLLCTRVNADNFKKTKNIFVKEIRNSVIQNLMSLKSRKSTNNMTNSNSDNTYYEQLYDGLKLSSIFFVKYENLKYEFFICRIIGIRHTQKNILKVEQNLFLLLFFLLFFDCLTFWIWSNITFILLAHVHFVNV